MKKLARSLVILGIASHVGLPVVDAFARGGGRGGSHMMFNPGGSHFGSATSGNGAMYTYRGPSFGHAAPGDGGSPQAGGGSTGGGGQMGSGSGTKGEGGGKGGSGSQEGDGTRGGGRIVVTDPGPSNHGKGRGDGQGEGSGGDGQPPPPPPPHRGHHGFAPPEFGEAFSAAGGGGGGGECEAGLHLSEVRQFADPIEGLAKISRETMLFVDNCNGSAVVVADALDRYAEALTKVAPRMPAELRSLPQIVSSAAHRVRQAPSKPAAARVLRAAVVAIHAVVHKAIELMRASDSDATRVATRGADLVARTVATAASALLRADTL